MTTQRKNSAMKTAHGGMLASMEEKELFLLFLLTLHCRTQAHAHTQECSLRHTNNWKQKKFETFFTFLFRVRTDRGVWVRHGNLRRTLKECLGVQTGEMLGGEEKGEGRIGFPLTESLGCPTCSSLKSSHCGTSSTPGCLFLSLGLTGCGAVEA